jgi:glycosyltransferase involved in cell wall biosynthesis
MERKVDTGEHEPFVSVVTPFYNGEPYLKECIQSVLGQSFGNFEYVLINNRSTDGSRETAEYFAEKDKRIRIVDNTEFLSQVENYNHSLRNISKDSAYCKVVAADDRILPTCLAQMVTVAESDHRIGVVGAYTILDWGNRSTVYLTGLPYEQKVFPGREVCRRFLKNGLYVFGSPTATLFRSEIVRSRDPFYYEASVTEDVDLFFEILQSWDFGFVHEILTYTRRSNESTISSMKDFHLMQLTEMVELLKYGPLYLEGEEYSKRRRTIEREYHLMLGRSLLKRKPKAFWDFHKRGLRFGGYDLTGGRIALCAVQATLDFLLNPKSTLDRIILRSAGAQE